MIQEKHNIQTNQSEKETNAIYFIEKLLSRSPYNIENYEIEYHTVEPEIEKPTQNEIDAAIDVLKNNKTSSDNDGIIIVTKSRITANRND